MGVKRWIQPVAVALLLAFTGLGAFTTRASAHATPHVLDIVFREDGGYVLLTNRGLIFGDKARKSWRLMCAEALKINTSEVPSLVATPDGRLLVATSVGLSATADDGCTWQPVEPFGDVSTPALAQDPSDPKRLYLAVFSPDASMKVGGLHMSEDSGLTWKQLVVANERDYVRSIRVAPSDPKHIYATGQSWPEMGGKYSYYVTQSRDGGKTWERHDVTLEEREREIRLFEISPKDPEVVTFRAASSDPMTIAERLLVSRDAGKTFESPMSMPLLSQLAFSADATKAWVVGLDGFFESTDDLKTFNRVGPALSMSYVVEHQKQVLACGYYKGFDSLENGIGTAASAADGFTAFMQLSEVTSPVQCEASSQTAMVCAPWWLDWERELSSGQFAADGGVAGGAGGAGGAVAGGAGAGAGGAGGASSAGKGGASGAAGGSAGAAGMISDAGVEPSTGHSAGCSVAQRGDESNSMFALASMLVGIAWLARRRRVARRAR